MSDKDMAKEVKKNDIIDFIAAHKDELVRTYGVRKIGLFGSYARGDVREDSDIDIVVELEKPDLFYLIGIKQTFEGAFRKKVDIVRLRDTMNIVLKQHLQQDAIYV